jgi:hypothetical protein
MNRSPLTAILWAGAFAALVLTCLLGDPSEALAICLVAVAGACVLLAHEAIDFILWRREVRRQQEEIDWHHARLDRDIHRNL